MEIQQVTLDGETINLKKRFDGWQIVYPIKNPDGTYNWKNFIMGGSWWNLIKTSLLVGFILVVVWMYQKDINTARESCLSSLINNIVIP